MNKVVKMSLNLKRWGIALSIFFLLPQTLWAEVRQEAVRFRNRGLERQRAGDLEGAFHFYQKALTLRPDFAMVHNDVGVLCEGRGWLEEAETAYRQALSIDANYHPAQYNLALLCQRQGLLPEAVRNLKQLIATSPHDDPWAHQARRRLDAILDQLVHQEERRRKQEKKGQLAAERAERKKQGEATRREKILQKIKRRQTAAEQKTLQDERLRISREKQARVKKRKQEEARATAPTEIAEEKQIPPQEEHEKQVGSLLEKGKRAFEKKRYEEAVEAFEALLVLDPQNREGQDYYEFSRPFVRGKKPYHYRAINSQSH